MDIQVLEVHVSVLKEVNVIHVLEDRVTNVNETMKFLQDLNTRKNKLKQSSGVVLTSFELDLKTTLVRLLGADIIDHVSKKYRQDVVDWVEGTTTHASNDFHVSNTNIDFTIV